MRICSVPDCGRLHEAKGFCTAHYGRWRNYGDPLGGPYALRSADEATRFWHWVSPGEPSDCWPVPYVNTRGYGSWKRPDGRHEGAHRTAWRLINGPPIGVIRHLCNNPPCVNPSHLADGTQSENILDQVQAGTYPYKRGEKANSVKYTYAQIESVLACRLQGMSYARVEAVTGVDRWTVRNVARRNYWPEVEGVRV